ncbi:hypothetical protein ENTCAN_08887, partial [Enterobacter cancerogenus ATCC 35316]
MIWWISPGGAALTGPTFVEVRTVFPHPGPLPKGEGDRVPSP